MIPRIVSLNEKKLVGKRLTMTFAKNNTFKLWQSFMPKRNEINNTLNNDLFSIQIYPDTFNFENFDINIEFEKWAAVEVVTFDSIPYEFEALILKGGQYAVFDYKGLSSDTKMFEYIFGVWLPKSEFSLDNRPHFEILGEKYKNNDINSEEQIWIPIKKK